MGFQANTARRRKVLKGMAAGGTLGLAGCLEGGLTGGSGRTVRAGILTGVSGPLSETGPPVRNAAQASANYLDENSDSFTIESQFADTATDPNQGISQANSLVDQGFPMIVGALSSSVTIQAANNVLVPNETVMCSPASTSPKITTLDDNDYVYRTALTDALQGQVMAQVGRSNMEGETAAILAQNDSYGQGIANAFASAWEDRGGTVQQQVSFATGESSYASKLSQALDGEPDVLMAVTFPESGLQLFKDYYSDYSQDFTNIIVSNGLRAEDLPADIGNSMQNVWGVSPLADGPSKDVFTREYEERVGTTKGKPFLPQAWDAMAVLCLANAAAGENSGPAIRDQVRNVANGPGETVTAGNIAEGMQMAADGQDINYQGATGPITFDENGDIAAANFELWRFQEGGIEVVTEIDFSPNGGG